MGHSWNSYRFRSEWRLTAPADDVYLALAEVLDYPRWWPEVRSVTRLGEDRCRQLVRSVLPYTLSIVSSRARVDPLERILEASLSGDLQGATRWTVRANQSDAVAVFEEDVIVEKALLRRLAAVGRPAFRANHAIMMTHGRKGLGAYLAGMRLGRTSSSP